MLRTKIPLVASAHARRYPPARWQNAAMPKVDILSRLRPETLQALALSRQQYASFQPSAAGALHAARQGYNHERAYWNSFAVDLPAVRDLALDTGHGTVALRLYQPAVASPLPVLLYAHGGGFMLGNLDTHDRICRLLAKQSGWAVLAIDYALAPEQQFPVQPNQVFAVLQHVATYGSAWGLDTRRIAVAGDSAGAHLSLGAALQWRDGGAPALAGQLLYYGAFGLQDSASRRLYGWADLDGLGDEDTAQYRNAYTATEQDRAHPRHNLLRSDMAGLPPTFIAAVSYDPLRDDSMALAEFCKERGVPHRLEMYAGVLHGFLHYSAVEPLALKAIEDGAAFLKAL
jgi:acetyl esterase